MALLQDIDLLPQKQEDNRNIREKKSYKNCLILKDKIFLATKKCRELYLGLNVFFIETKKFFHGNRYSPHIIVITLGMIVAITNLTQKITAATNTVEFVNINPEDQLAIAKNIDRYTPQITNDSEAIQKAILANAMSEGFISSTGTVATEITNREEPSVLPSNEAKTIQYTVINGDTLSGLGMKFDVKIATLKYVNDINDADSITPGQKLKIPPKGYEVSVTQIAKKEKENKQKLAQASRNTVTRSESSGRATRSAQTVRTNPGSRANGYPYGWCTYYVATRRYIPSSWGNARSWLSSAKQAGHSTGSEPVAGAVVVTSESGLGHVAYVESVNGSSITISEMNYEGWGVVSRRIISAYGGVVRGYVY